MLPDKVTEDSQKRCDEIHVRSHGIAKKYDVIKESNEKSSERFWDQQVKWGNVIAIAILHVVAIYCYVTFPYTKRFKTVIFGWITFIFAGLGITAGAHRLWTHCSYKAKTPLRIILLCFFCTAGMNSVFNWVRDHRAHHKFSETDADPHNSRRGFFFSHVGWLMLRRHPEVIKKGRQIDMSDILADPIVAIGEKYFLPLKIFFCFVLPVIIPVYFWNEDWYYAIVSQWFMRYTFILNATWSVNSVAHMFGWRPYDKSIAPTENVLVSWITSGEGWHNYHHVFPWDYKASEISHPFMDLSTYFIDAFATIGWACDLKQPSEDLVRRTVARKGGGSRDEVPVPFDPPVLSSCRTERLQSSLG